MKEFILSQEDRERIIFLLDDVKKTIDSDFPLSHIKLKRAEEFMTKVFFENQ